MNAPEQIRAEYVETLIAHSNPELHGQHCPVSRTKGKSTACDCWRRGQINEQVEALAEAGLLPTGVRWSIAWRHVPESTPESGGQATPIPPHPRIGTGREVSE